MESLEIDDAGGDPNFVTNSNSVVSGKATHNEMTKADY